MTAAIGTTTSTSTSDSTLNIASDPHTTAHSPEVGVETQVMLMAESQSQSSEFDSLPPALSDKSLLERIPTTQSSITAVSSSAPVPTTVKAQTFNTTSTSPRVVSEGARLAPPPTMSSADPHEASESTWSAEDIDAARSRMMGFAHATRSLGNLRGQKTIRRDRALSDSRPPLPPSIPSANSVHPSVSVSIQSPTNASPPKAKKQGGFAGFFRRLTTRTPKLKEKDKNVAPPAARYQSATMSKLPSSTASRPPLAPSRSEIRSTARPVPSRQMSAPAPAPAPVSGSADSKLGRQRTVPAKPRPPPLVTGTEDVLEEEPEPTLTTTSNSVAGPQQQPPAIATPTLTNESSLSSRQKEMDPLRIPLPPSPLPSTDRGSASDYLTAGAGSSILPLPLPSPPTLQRAASLSPTTTPRLSSSGNLSPVLPSGSRSRSASPRGMRMHLTPAVEEFQATPEIKDDQDTTRVQKEMGMENEMEKTDQIRPLGGLRIDTRARSASPGSTAPVPILAPGLSSNNNNNNNNNGPLSATESVLRTPTSLFSNSASALASTSIPPVPPVPALASTSETSESETELEPAPKSKRDADDDVDVNINIKDDPAYAHLTEAQKLVMQARAKASGKTITSSLNTGTGIAPGARAGNGVNSRHHSEVKTKEELEEELEDLDHLDAPMYAGSSPPRKAPIGSGYVELSRKGSKWRKSVMGLSDTLNRKQSSRVPTVEARSAAAGMTNRQSVQVPILQQWQQQQQQQQPQQRDRPEQQQQQHHHQHHPAYARDRRQQRVAAHRASCQPTLHSNASIAAQMRGIKDDREKETAETFFMT